MATEVGSDIALIQDEDMLRKMWQQTEDFGKKKEIRMRMYKLREQRLKEFYTTGEMIQTETTSKRSSTRTHTESITDQGFMTMKTKEIRDSESPTEDYQRQSNTNANYYVSSKSDESDGNRGIVQMDQLTSSIKPSDEFTQNSIQTSVSSSTSSKWESSQTIVSVSDEVQRADVNLSSKFISNEQSNDDHQLTYDTSFNKQNDSNIDTKITELITTTNVDSIKREGNTHNNSQYSNDHQANVETYTTITSNVDSFEPISENIQNNYSTRADNNYSSTSNVDSFEPISENIQTKNSTRTGKNYSSDVSTNKSENIVIITDNTILNEHQKLDSYLPTEQLTDSVTKSNSIVSSEEIVIKKVDDQIKVSPKGAPKGEPKGEPKENSEGQYVTTYQHSYQQPKISVDVSPAHDAFARSLRSTPERSSPSPCRERASPERRFKSASPEKYRASPEKSGSPPKSLKSSARRKLSSTHTKDLSKKRSNTPTRGEKYDSSDDSDCSGATHGTYDKFKNHDAKRSLFKEENKITSTKYNQKSPTTSPVRREKSPGYSSEGSVGKEVRKSSTNVKNSSHESSPERSAFKPVKNYKIPRTQHVTRDGKISHTTQEENVYTNSFTSKNSAIDVNKLIEVIKDENDVNTNSVSTTQDIINNIVDSKKKSIQEKFIIEEQTCTSSEEVDNAKIIKESKYHTEIDKTNREKSPSKGPTKENKLNQDEFIESEKLNIMKENTKISDVITIKSKENSPVKEVKPVTKDTTKAPVAKPSEKISPSPNNKSVTPSKKITSAIPSSVKKSTPSSIEKTPSKKNLIHKDSKENVLHKTVKKDLSKEKVDIKITKSDSKTLINKNSKEIVTPKLVIKKPSQEMLVDKKTTISYRNKLTSPESKPKVQEPIKVIEKKDSNTKPKASISPQSSQKKLGVTKPSTETRTITDTKRITENKNVKRIPSNIVTRPKTFTSTKPNIYETPSKVSKPNSKAIPTSLTMKYQIRKTTQSNLNKTVKVEGTKNVGVKSKNLQDEMPPNNFESDTDDIEDMIEQPIYTQINSSKSSASSSSSSEDENENDEDDVQKIKALDNIRIEAEEEYGKKMTNKDTLLNVLVQLPPSSRESSPEYSTRFGQPYHSVSDDASLPRYADVVSEPEDINDYKLYNNRYDIVTDLDEETNVTVADRVSKFLNNVNKQDDIKTTEIVKSPQAVKKAKQIFESIAKGQIEETDVNDDESEPEIVHSVVHDSPKDTKDTQPSLLTRKISGAPDYKSRKEFFENRKLNDTPVKTSSLTPKTVIRSSSIKDRRASFEAKNDKKTPLQDKTNAPKAITPDTKSRSPDRITKSPTKITNTEIFDVKVEEINKSRRLSGSKTVKDRKATFENNEVARKPAKENKTVQRDQSPSPVMNPGRLPEKHTKSTTVVTDINTSEHVLDRRVTSPNRSKQSPEKAATISSINKVNDSVSRKVSSKSPDRKIIETPERSTAKSPERRVVTDTYRNRREQDTVTTTKQRTTTTVKTESDVTTTTASVPKNTTTTFKSTSVHTTDDEIQIEEIFDLHVLEIMLEKAVGYDRRRRIRAQIRIVKRQLESSKSGKETTNAITRVSKTVVRDGSPAKPQKQNNVTAVDKSVEFVKNKKTEIKKERSVSPEKSHYATPNGNSRSPSPRKVTVGPVEDTRSPLPQKPVRQTEKGRSPSPQKTVARNVEKVRSPSPQKNIAPAEKDRSPSPKKMSVDKQHQDVKSNRNDKSDLTRSSTVTSSISTTVTTTNKVKSEQVSTSILQEQNVTDLITSSYGVGPTDDNGRPLFGLRALRKTNNNQTTVNDSFSNEVDSYTVSNQPSKPLYSLKAIQSENACTVQESRTVYQKVSEQKGGVDQLITDHKGKPLFGLKALQSIGKNEEEPPIYEDMPEPPVSPQLKELVLKHEKHAKENSKLETQPRQKPKAKFRDSFILDSKDESLYSNYQQNGFTDPNSITLRSIIKKSDDDQSNETIVKSKSQSTVFHSKSVMRSDGTGNVSVTQDFVKGEVSSVNDQEPSGKLIQGHYTYQSPDDSNAKNGIAKVTTVTKVIGGKDTGPEITDITEELNNSDQVDNNKSVKKNRTNDKFESIQKRFSQENFDQDSRRSSKETNGYEKIEGSPQSTPRSSLVRGDSIKALQHKFQQATVSSSLKQNRSAKSESPNTVRQTDANTVTTKVNSSKTSGSSFLDNSSRVTGVQDVLTRMRNADLVVESGDTSEDIEARALLNKFLGASVILHGMEQGGKSPISNQTTTTSSASLVNQVEKQRAQKSPATRNNLNEQDLDNIWDEKQLQILLESCPDYDQRRIIRARLRQIMAEHKACADVVALANTEDGSTTANESKEVTETKSTSSVSGKTGSGSYVKSEVHTRSTTTTTSSSSNRLTKANSVSSSPFAKFQQLERQNSAPNSQTRPCYKFTEPALARSASTIKDRLLNWVKAQTKEYKNLQITNFSTSWSDGLAFCALIHHFYPEAFDYDKLKPENRRENFEIAFKVAEDEAGIAPLLDVEDMVVMRKPDWKCVFTYVQTFYRRFHNTPQAAKPSF